MPEDFQTLVASFSSASALSQYMQADLSYASAEQRVLSRHSGYWWKTPEETYTDGYGFCYDLAAFALYGLERSRITEAQILFVAWGRWGIDSGSGHLVCIYSEGDNYFSIDNGVLKGPFTFRQLLLSAARGRRILSYRLFSTRDIPYHMTYQDMKGFVDRRYNSNEQIKNEE